MDGRQPKLANKVALITGAGSGIGRATALLFAREGAKVVAVDIDDVRGRETVETIRQQGGEAVFVLADVTQATDAERMVNVAVETYGRLDILFNNAGISRRGSVETISEEDWDAVIGVNLKSVFLGSKYAIPVMKRQGGGVIVNTASGAGLVGVAGAARYCASKGGFVLLTKQMAIDYDRDNIRVNAICPPAVDTPPMEARFRESPNPAEAKRQYEAQLPRGRMLAPEEVAHSVLYLTCDDTSFLNGNPFML